MITSRYAYDLQGHSLILNSQDIEFVKEAFGIKDDSITGCLVLVGDGEYIDAWFTESSTPYSITAIYHPASYYDKSQPVH